MAIYSLSLNTTVATTGAASADLKSSAANTPRIMEWGGNLGAATASTYGLGRSGNVPTQTSPVLLQAEDVGAAAAVSGMAVAWSVAPTVPTQFFRRIFLAGTIGVGWSFTFPRGITLAVSTSILNWNLATNSASTNVYFVADE